jgi:hypothetical protein
VVVQRGAHLADGPVAAHEQLWLLLQQWSAAPSLLLSLSLQHRCLLLIDADRPAIGPQPVHLGGRGQDEQVIAVAHLEHVEAERHESQQVGRGRDRDARDHGVLGG